MGRYQCIHCENEAEFDSNICTPCSIESAAIRSQLNFSILEFYYCIKCGEKVAMSNLSHMETCEEE